MASASRDDVLKALDQIIDPKSGRSVVHEGLIQGLVGYGTGQRPRLDERRQQAAPLQRFHA